MKRMLGWIFIAAGAVGTVYGGYYVLAGESRAMLHPIPISAMYGGLSGLALLTFGLIWSRD